MQVLNRWKKQSKRGAVFVIVAIVLPVLLVLTGVSFDFGYLYVARNKLQDVADAAALAGAVKLSSEGRYAGNPAIQPVRSSDLPVGKAILEYVKANDAAFEGLCVFDESNPSNTFAYKGAYRVNGNDGTYTWNNTITDINTVDTTDKDKDVVKLVDLNCWINPDFGPQIDANKKVKVEYAVTGRLNTTNFLEYFTNGTEHGLKYDELEYGVQQTDTISDYVDDDRVRVRLTKRISLPFLGIFSDNLNNILVTVKAAAGGGKSEEKEILTFNGPIICGNVEENESAGKITYAKGASIRVISNSYLNLDNRPKGLYVTNGAGYDAGKLIKDYHGVQYLNLGNESGDTANSIYLPKWLETNYGTNDEEKEKIQVAFDEKQKMRNAVTAVQTAYTTYKASLTSAKISEYKAGNNDSTSKKRYIDAENPVVKNPVNDMEIYIDVSPKNGRYFNDQIYNRNDSGKVSLEDYNFAGFKGSIASVYIKTPYGTSDLVALNTNGISFGNVMTDATLNIIGSNNHFNGVVLSSSWNLYIGGNGNSFFDNQIEYPFYVHRDSLSNTEQYKGVKAGIFCENGTIHLANQYDITDYKAKQPTSHGLTLQFDNSARVYQYDKDNNIVGELYERWYINGPVGSDNEPVKMYYHFDQKSNNGYFINKAGIKYEYVYHTKENAFDNNKTGHYFWAHGYEGLFWDVIFTIFQIKRELLFNGTKWDNVNIHGKLYNQNIPMNTSSNVFSGPSNNDSFTEKFGSYQSTTTTIKSGTGTGDIRLVE